jgi:hypothetical protein
MTALRSRRRRSTVVAAGAVVLAVAAAAAIGIVGGLTLYHSTEGSDASDDRPELTFPETPTGLLAAVDDDGNLASLALFVVRPSGAGGSIVTVPVSADASAGEGTERLPLAETADLTGTESVQREAEILLGLAVESFEVADRARLEELLSPVGDIEVDLPMDVTDADGQVVAEQGPQTMDPQTAAAVLVARDPAVPAAEQYPAATAVWAAVAEAVDDGISDVDGIQAPSGGEAAGAPEPSDGIAVVVGQALGGPLAARGLRAATVADARNPRDVDVVVLDRAELAFVFGQIAPRKVAAPNPGLTFRLEVPFSEDDLDEVGMSKDELAYRAISQLLFVRGNVQSVDTTTGDVSERTTIEVADESLVPAVESTDNLFGDIDVEVAEERIVGVDAAIRLGTNYLDDLAAEEGDD